ncbi:alpha/beta hydrolase fold-1 domain-containing protein [Tieghemostelium lacteum]|uniref:Maspardin n=1 Tax=Tieghemostelium lacteum TaxID=361077 RepID=A0A151ZCX4_TIELA|nr:alpha/beta hydrolase fold-1 domain-containing protein [Tieghemostelium lacteum]|eukprot:KYQ91775.1 alpha/beta hydrolase fold-1 domain-containing protein [Tieghemostelium lacteum]
MNSSDVALLSSEPYILFKSWVPQQKISIGTVNEKLWKYYDFGPKKDTIPLVFISPGTAEIFYKQFVSLCPKGYRFISVQFSPYDSLLGWCKGFERFLDRLGLEKIHLFGTSLGGYLAQCFYQTRPSRVISMILNNTFCDTQYYHDNSSCAAMFSILPEFMLKKIILSNFPSGKLDKEMCDTVDFMVYQIESLQQQELASRLTLNCSIGLLNPSGGLMENITIIDSLDTVSVPEKLREECYKYYPNAKIALIKEGGDFVYISRSDEVNIHIQVHLRNFGLDPVNNPKSDETTNNNNINNNNNNNNNTTQIKKEKLNKPLKTKDTNQFNKSSIFEDEHE